MALHLRIIIPPLLPTAPLPAVQSRQSSPTARKLRRIIIHIQINQQPSPTARRGAFCKNLKLQQHPVPHQLHSQAWLPKHTDLQASLQKPIAQM